MRDNPRSQIAVCTNSEELVTDSIDHLNPMTGLVLLELEYDEQ